MSQILVLEMVFYRPQFFCWVLVRNSTTTSLLVLSWHMIATQRLEWRLSPPQWGSRHSRWLECPRVKQFLFYLKFFFFFFFLAVLGLHGGMWDLSSWTRIRICIPCIGRWIFNHWTTSKVPQGLFITWLSATKCSLPAPSWSVALFLWRPSASPAILQDPQPSRPFGSLWVSWSLPGLLKPPSTSAFTPVKWRKLNPLHQVVKCTWIASGKEFTCQCRR